LWVGNGVRKHHQKFIFSLLVSFATFLLFTTADAANRSKSPTIYDLNNDTDVSRTEFDVTTNTEKRFDKIDSSQKIAVTEFK